MVFNAETLRNRGIMKIKKIAIMMLVVGFPFLTFAGIRNKRPIQAQLMGALILGNGVSVGYNLNDHLFLGGEYFSMKLTSKNEDDNDEINIAFSTTQLNARYHLFENSAFYLQAGLAQRNWKVEANGTGDIGLSGVTADYTWTFEWPKTAFSYGLGFNWIADFGLSGGFYLGMLSGSKPTLKGKINHAAGFILQPEIDREINEYYKKNNLDRFSSIPVIAGYIGYNF